MVGEVLDGFADVESGHSVRAGHEPVRDQLRPTFRGLAQDPADRLAHEELALLEHAIGESSERVPFPVADSGAVDSVSTSTAASRRSWILPTRSGRLLHGPEHAW